MADIYEVSVAMDLRDELSEREVAELQWHLGLGPEPERLSIVSHDLGELVTEDHPAPLLGSRGAAWKVGGALISVLVRRDEGWALTARQEIHPDDCDRLGELLDWLATKASDRHRPFDGSVHIGWIRFYEEDRPNPLMVRGGRTVWP
ncbi:hypothetical protein ACWGQL_31055 [Streptomyces lydicus]